MILLKLLQFLLMFFTLNFGIIFTKKKHINKMIQIIKINNLNNLLLDSNTVSDIHQFRIFI